MKDLNKKIIDWARERELDKKGTITGQAIKTIEEVAELLKGISKNNLDMIKDSIGDVYVTLVIGVLITFKSDEMMDVICGMPELDDGDIFRMRGVSKSDKMLDGLQLIKVFEGAYLGNTFYWQDRIVSAIRILKIVCLDYELKLEDCIDGAYNEISGRKGRVVNGSFVKEGDL